ncbi:MAG: hypothetical protein Q7S22_01000 [Candidatus Micrarchaeota archaeon]|nr:hypothetical protein [Candidatus Micrarchaeota archaeon]
MEFKDILEASKLPIIVGIVFNAILSIVPYLIGSLFIVPYQIASNVIFVIFFLILSYGGNFLLFFYSGYRSAKNFNRPLVDCGAISSFSSICVGIVTSVIVSIVFVITTFERPLSNNFIVTAAGVVLLFGIAAVSSLITIIISGVVNFIVGAIGGAIGGAK